MDAAKTLIRTVVRTFWSTKHVLVIDALMIHSAINVEDLAYLLSSLPKDVRRLVGPLRTARIISTGTQNEARVGSTRGMNREYYYIPFHVAIDAIKYRLMGLMRKVEDLYKRDTVRKDWRCPVCKAEWEELEVLDKFGPQGFECHRCGNTLVRTEQASEPHGGHEKIKKLNIQLKKIQDLIDVVDHQEIPKNDFADALERKKPVPRDKDGSGASQYVVLKDKRGGQRNVAEHTNAANLNINMTTGADQEAQEEAKKEIRRQELAKQNQLPSWHTTSVVAGYKDGIKAEEAAGEGLSNGTQLLKEESEEKKPDLASSQDDELAAYLAEMQQEKEEAAKKAAEEDAESDDEGEDEFEDVATPSVAGTPMNGNTASETPASSQQALMNGLKRELESESGGSSMVNTPAAAAADEPGAKKIRLANGPVKVAATPTAEDSDEEGDFEDCR